MTGLRTLSEFPIARTRPHGYAAAPVVCEYDVNDDGYVDESDASAILAVAITFEGYCYPGVICRHDVNFDCVVDEDDYDAVLEHIGSCPHEPCPCGSGDSFAYAPGGGLSIERFTEAITAVASQLSEEELAMAWEHFLAYYNGQ